MVYSIDKEYKNPRWVYKPDFKSKEYTVRIVKKDNRVYTRVYKDDKLVARILVKNIDNKAYNIARIYNYYTVIDIKYYLEENIFIIK